MNCNKKASSGVTLMEAVIGLSMWMILSLSVLFAWQHTSDRTAALLERQSTFENARGAMDFLITNIQMAHTIELEVGQNFTLRRITLSQLNPDEVPHEYSFFFDVNARRTDTWYSQLQLGLFDRAFPNRRIGRNEVASGIALVTVEPVGRRRMNVAITTNCEDAIFLESSVDIRYKNLIVIHR
ncbi:MAG: hypothetical protein FWE42_04615 [Defluviitaleaceae bacterium]|nr:hypothetical protein [Defluviitaleaceae bacterium]